ncbi:type ISP restriction/modification enzyme [Cutibacterium avidum]|nr:hypothetical protein APY06_03195 [Cutibacterium avidum]
MQSGIIDPADLARKYGVDGHAGELWCNEIMLLAYYISCVNVETTYQSLLAEQQGVEAAKVAYQPFGGATLTDTFQISEDGDKADTSLIPANNARIETQLATPIRVIVGNPPYSAGQTSANDNNANLKYPTLDARIAGTYAARSTSTNKNSLYDSYIRAFRWATDRLGEQGVLAFVSNNGWVDGNTADGIRRSFADDFSDVYLYNLRGNARTAGILRRQEGGGIFDSGARTGVAVLIAVKNPARTGTARIHYHGVPDYQTREEKLSDLDEACLSTVGWRTITPNEDGDWLNQRDESFATFPAIGIKDVKDPSLRHFTLHSRGIATSRDAWCYNFSVDKVEHNMRRMLDTYNAEAAAGHTKAEQLDNNPTRISWSRGLVADALRGRHHQYRSERRYPAATYRPFTKQSVYFDRPLNDMVYRLESIFPTPHHTNLGYYIVGMGSAVPFSLVALNDLPNLHVTGAGSGGQFFPAGPMKKPPTTPSWALVATSTSGVTVASITSPTRS